MKRQIRGFFLKEPLAARKPATMRLIYESLWWPTSPSCSVVIKTEP